MIKKILEVIMLCFLNFLAYSHGLKEAEQTKTSVTFDWWPTQKYTKNNKKPHTESNDLYINPMTCNLNPIDSKEDGENQEKGKSKQGLGISVGWGAPYGYGVEYSYISSGHFDFNVGLGFSFSGLRTGIGTRLFFEKEGSSPFWGINFIYTTGLSKYNVTINGESAEFKNFSDQAVFFRGGYKIEQDNYAHMITLGYGIAFEKMGAERISGSRSSNLQSFADVQALGGLEISYTLIFKFG